MNPPQEFFDEYQKLRERMDWFDAGMGRGQDVAQARLFLADYTEFYEKWHPLITEPKLRAGLEAGCQDLAGLRNHLEQLYLAHLYEVIEARKDWWVGEQLLKTAVHFIDLMKNAPAALRPELVAIHRKYMNKDYEPVSYYQDTEANANAEEADYRKALAGLEVDWPDRVDAGMRERLEKLDRVAAEAWQEEVAAQQNALE